MSTYDLATLQQLIWDRVENNQVLYLAAEVTAVANEALRVTNLFTAFNAGSVQLPGFTVAGQLLYSVPDGILYPTRVAFEGRDLDKISLTAIGQNFRTWATDDSNNYGPVARWIPIGIRTFAIHPIDAVGGNNLTITGVMETTQLAAAGDVCELDDEFVSLVTEYGGHRLVLKEGGKVFADASVLIQSFWHTMKSLRTWQYLKMPRYFVQVEEPK